MDTVLGKPGTGGLVTVVDRKARLLLAAKIEDKTAAAVQVALIRLLDGLECRKPDDGQWQGVCQAQGDIRRTGGSCVFHPSPQPLGAGYKREYERTHSQISAQGTRFSGGETMMFCGL